MPTSSAADSAPAEILRRIVDAVMAAVVGQRPTIERALTTMVAGGHLLIEDVPGTGKSVLARSLSNSISGSHSRIQFTPDLLPSDITGSTVFDQRTTEFDFRTGPIFANVVIADEINRASPKTQSALLEVMEEGTVTVDGISHSVPTPFMVIATQNPVERSGTYKLPDAQLDRFMMTVRLGFPDQNSLLSILDQSDTRQRADLVHPVATAAMVTALMTAADRVRVDRAILAYVAALAECTHQLTAVEFGVSVRGALAVVRAAKAWALADGRNYVVPDDVIELIPQVWRHRLVARSDERRSADTDALIEHILASVRPPTRRME